MNQIQKKKKKETSRIPGRPPVSPVRLRRSLRLSNTRRRTRRTAVPAWRPAWPRLYRPPSRWSAAAAAGGGSEGGTSAPLIGLEEEESRGHGIEPRHGQQQ